LGSPPPDSWRTVFGDEPALRLDVTPGRVALTATRDREVEVVWLDSSLDEIGRQQVTLPYPGVATAVGEARHALVVSGADWGLAYAPLDDSGVGSWHTLLPQPFLGPRAWSAGSGYGVVASSGIVTADAFLLCGEGP